MLRAAPMIGNRPLPERAPGPPPRSHPDRRPRYSRPPASDADERRISLLWDNLRELDVIALTPTAQEQAWQVVWRVPGERASPANRFASLVLRPAAVRVGRHRAAAGHARTALADRSDQRPPRRCSGCDRWPRRRPVAIAGGTGSRAAGARRRPRSPSASRRPAGDRGAADADAFAQVLAQARPGVRVAITWIASSGGEVPRPNRSPAGSWSTRTPLRGSLTGNASP